MSKNTFYVSCPIDTYSGYGARSRDFVKALIELNEYDVRILPQRWGMTPFGFIEDHIEEWGFLKQHIVPQLMEQPDIWCQITVPNEFQPVGKYNIGLTAGIETTVCAPQWIEGCNRMNLVLTSSKHAKTVFETTNYQINNKQTNQTQGELKLSKPIEVLIEGANLEIYKPLDVKEFTSKNLVKDLDSIKESFAYLFVGHWMQGQLGEDRKNVGLLVKAFYETFKNKSKKPALILKTSQVGSSYMDRDELIAKIKAIKATVKSNNLPNIYLLHGEFTNEEMNQIYNHPKVKAMVNLTKGEGFGRPLLEFSLVNKPIITTNWSGHIDYLNPEFVTLLPGTLTKVHPSAANGMLMQEAEWFSVDTGHAGHYLKDVFENYKRYTENAKRQGFQSRTKFSFNAMKEKLDNLFTEKIPEFPKQVQLQLPKLNKIELPKLKKVEQ